MWNFINIEDQERFQRGSFFIFMTDEGHNNSQIIPSNNQQTFPSKNRLAFKVFRHVVLNLHHLSSKPSVLNGSRYQSLNGALVETFHKMSRGVACRFNMCNSCQNILIMMVVRLQRYQWVHDHSTTIKCAHVCIFIDASSLWQAMDLTILMEKPSKEFCTHTVCHMRPFEQFGEHALCMTTGKPKAKNVKS